MSQSEQNVNNKESKSILDEVITSQQERDWQELDPNKIVFGLVQELPSRTESIIVRRFGLDGKGKKTLEEIGKSYGITRERVRQIESVTIKDMRKKGKLDNLAPVEEHIEMILTEYGQIMHHDHLIDTFITRLDNKNINNHLVEFILELSDKFEKHNETEITHRAWSIKNASTEMIHEINEAFKEVLEGHGKPIHSEKVLDHISDHEVYKKYEEIIDEKSVASYLTISKHFMQNPFAEWGLREWSEITPRGVKDKAYLVLAKKGDPLHFRDITKSINDSGFSGRQACQQTVHNELIKDERFVLIGRGIYALKEWGYSEGTVADVVENLLRKNDTLSRKEIIDGVFKQRMVKRNTIILALQDKNRFAKVSKDQFKLAAKEEVK
ncbi:MAG: HTH domain-containing protein [bacterium]